MNNLKTFLEGSDLRSIAKVDLLIPLIKTQNDFDKLFKSLFSDERLIVMRAVDAIEKITKNNHDLLKTHKKDLLKFLNNAQDKEFKWHLALMITRVDLNNKELEQVWQTLSKWARNKAESRIVRVNAIQSLFDLNNNMTLKKQLGLIFENLKKENIPSINARIRRLSKIK